MTNWYVKREDQIIGPLTQQRLEELTTLGQIQESDLVKLGKDGGFIPAGEIPELITEFQDIDLQSGDYSRRELPVKKTSHIFIKSAIIIVSTYIVIVLVAFIFTGIQQARDAALRSKIKNNLQQIGTALENYNLEHNRKETLRSTSQ